MEAAQPFQNDVISTGDSARPSRNGEISLQTRGKYHSWPDPSTPLRSDRDDKRRRHATWDDDENRSEKVKWYARDSHVMMAFYGMKLYVRISFQT